MAKKIRPGRYYQRSDAPVRLIADRGKHPIKHDIRAMLDHLSDLVPVDRARSLARHADWHGLKNSINWQHYREILKRPSSKIVAVRHQAAELGVRKINGAFDQKGRVVHFRKREPGESFNFDVLDAATQERIREAQDELIQQLEQSARDAIDQIITSGALTGLGPDDIVDDIRELIGLTDNQAAAVMNYRAALEALDPRALSRRLRNPDLDPEVQAAIDAGQDLDTAVVDKLVNDYTENFLDHRAESIAQTESTRAANMGLQDAYAQAIDRGALPAEAIRQYWQIAHDEKTCAICLEIPGLNDQGVAIGDAFNSPIGPVMAPPDPHTRCRCSIEIVTNLDLLPEESDVAA